MAQTPALEVVSPANGTVRDTGFFGHPRGLSTLFFTELWERFSYYGMRAILLLFMTAAVAEGGLGWDAAKAGPIYGLYTALVYLTALPGGWIADRLLGQRRSVLLGGIVIALGHVSLDLPQPRHLLPRALLLIVVGTGFLKPNISAMVGGLYTPEDERRDAGFSIFYMGINLGGFISPLIVGFLAQSVQFRGFLQSHGINPANSWHWGFGAAAVGMMLGLVQYVLGGGRLGTVGLRPAITDPETHAKDRRKLLIATVVFAALVGLAFLLHLSMSDVTRYVGYALIATPIIYFIVLFRQPWTPTERKHLLAILAFFIFACLFWSGLRAGGSTLNLFAERFTSNSMLGFSFPASWLQAVNSAFIWMLAPVFAWIWLALGRRRREPSSPSKFAYGLFFAGLGFLVMVGAAVSSGPAGGRVTPLWLILVYLCHTIGELCLSPVGLSAMTKLAPAKVVSQMLGIWFLATSLGNFMGGQVAGVFEKFPLPMIFGAVAAVCFVFTVIAIILIKPLKRLMGEVH